MPLVCILKQKYFIHTSCLILSEMHSTTPVDPAASRANLSLHSPFSMRKDARFLPKNDFS